MTSAALALRSPYFFGAAPDIGESDEARKIEEYQEEALEGYRSQRALEPYLSALSSKAFLAVHTQWPNVCEEMFDALAERFPEDLLNLVSSGSLAPSDLTFAAEVAGKIPDGEAVRATLMPLLEHGSAIVREGAIYGLREHIDDRASMKLRELAKVDASPAVRHVASDILHELCESR